MHGMASFPQVLHAISDAWQNRRQEVLDQADKVMDAVGRYLGGPAEAGAVGAEAVQRLANHLLQHFDAEHGGFGAAPKFPQPATLAFLIAVYDNNQTESIRDAIEQTLDRMARGGIFDQIGGGFHRYSTDAKWLVPHFEKMLYDNGQLLETYALAWQRSESPALRRQCERTLRETADYIEREMIDARGAFYSAQDAEVHGREGGSYLWTAQEVREAIDDDTLAERALTLYGLDRGTNFRDPHDPDARPANVLHLPAALEQVAEQWDMSVEAVDELRQQINAKLLAVRDARPQPRTDDKVLVAWNGLMIAGLAKAGALLDEARYVELAKQAAEAIERHMKKPDGSLYRSMRQGTCAIPGQLEDYALFAHGLIELHRATGQGGWLERARAVNEQAIALFECGGGGYYDTLADQDDLLVRLHSAVDGSMPSGNSQMAHNLLDLYQLTDDAVFLERACQDLRRFAEPMTQQPQAMPRMAHALLRALEIAPEKFEQAQSSESSAGAGPDEPVQVQLDRTTVDLSEGEAALAITLRPEAGYHINAHDPGDSAVTPLTVELADETNVELKVEYPEGQARQYDFADAPLVVHEGETVVRVRLLRAPTAGRDESAQSSRDSTLVVRYQPCSDRACYAPRSERMTLHITGLA
jgi:uncharacterized protein YyaL (SSP411 family)